MMYFKDVVSLLTVLTQSGRLFYSQFHADIGAVHRQSLRHRLPSGGEAPDCREKHRLTSRLEDCCIKAWLLKEMPGEFRVIQACSWIDL